MMLKNNLRNRIAGRYPYQGMSLIQKQGVVMINSIFKSLNILFARLGLPDDDASINHFVANHRPLSGDVPLESAPWWTPSQASFLSEAIDSDSDWSDVTDELNSLLR